MSYLGSGALLAFIFESRLDFDFSFEKVVDSHLRERLIE
jgi:hypothetical protein